MAKNETQKIITNLLRIIASKNYIIEIRSNKNYKTQLGPTTDYEFVKNNYRQYSNATLVFTCPHNLTYPASFSYNIAENKIEVCCYYKELASDLLEEAKFLCDIGY